MISTKAIGWNDIRNEKKILKQWHRKYFVRGFS